MTEEISSANDKSAALDIQPNTGSACGPWPQTQCRPRIDHDAKRTCKIGSLEPMAFRSSQKRCRPRWIANFRKVGTSTADLKSLHHKRRGLQGLQI